jgi:hypothetical protein
VKLRTTSLLLIAFAASAGVFTFAPQAHADYAVLKSGVRLHITGYEQTGETIRLTITGGTVEVPAAELASIEPEDQFTAPPVALVAAQGPYGSLIRAAAEKHGVDEKLITHVIAVESNFNPRAASPKQARGLMQLLPTTAAKYSVSNIFESVAGAGRLQCRTANGDPLRRHPALPRNAEIRAENHHDSGPRKVTDPQQLGRRSFF